MKVWHTWVFKAGHYDCNCWTTPKDFIGDYFDKLRGPAITKKLEREHRITVIIENDS